MKFKRLIEEQNRLEALKNRNELTDYGLEMLTELNQTLQLLQTDVVGQSEQLTAFAEYCDEKHGLFIPSWMIDGYNKSR